MHNEVFDDYQIATSWNVEIVQYSGNNSSFVAKAKSTLGYLI